MRTHRMIEMGLSKNRDGRMRGPSPPPWAMSTISQKARQELVWWLVASVAFMLAGSFASAEQPSMPDPKKSEYECVIEPQQVVKIASPVVGVIARLDVDRGDVVRRARSSAC